MAGTAASVTDALMDAALDCIILMDADGRIVDFNPAAVATFGIEREQALGQELATLVIPGDLRDAHRAALARYLDTGAPTILDRRLELRAIRADGSEFPAELTVTDIGTPEQRLFAGFVRDITASVQARDELAAAELRARHIAQTLQRSLLPPALPAPDRIELAAVFLPVGDGTELGGDFYDVFDTGPDRWGIVIGDVVGKGIEAAAATALARFTLRAAAVPGDRSPAALLAVLNDQLLRQMPTQFCSVAYAEVDTAAPGISVRLSAGGHPLPFLLRSDGDVRPAGRHGSLLGAVAAPVLEDVDLQLEPGDALVFYTDGVTESPTVDGLLGEDRLGELISGCRGKPASTIAERIEQVATAGSDVEHPRRDDIAVVVVRAL